MIEYKRTAYTFRYGDDQFWLDIGVPWTCDALHYIMEKMESDYCELNLAVMEKSDG